MKIYTKTGDQGITALFGGTRVSKAHVRIETYGTVDELNSNIGLLRDQEINVLRRRELTEIQNNLLVIGSMLATEPGNDKVWIPKLQESEVTLMEERIDHMSSLLPEMKHFVLPGGHISISVCHVVRCVCRRTERLVVALNELEKVDPIITIYLNRLSDYLFMLSRLIAQELNVEQTPWIPKKEENG